MTIKISRRLPSSFPLDGTVICISVRRLTQAQLLDLAEEREALERVDPPVDGSAAPEPTKAQKLALSAYTCRVISENVAIDPGQLVGDDDQPITSGAQLVEYYSGREDIMAAVGGLVIAENRASPRQKKAWQSALGSALGWPEWMSAPSGDAPAPTADAAAPKASSVSVAVTSPTTPSPDASSGPEAESTSDAVPSGI